MREVFLLAKFKNMRRIPVVASIAAAVGYFFLND